MVKPTICHGQRNDHIPRSPAPRRVYCSPKRHTCLPCICNSPRYSPQAPWQYHTPKTYSCQRLYCHCGTHMASPSWRGPYSAANRETFYRPPNFPRLRRAASGPVNSGMNPYKNNTRAHKCTYLRSTGSALCSQNTRKHCMCQASRETYPRTRLSARPFVPARL